MGLVSSLAEDGRCFQTLVSLRRRFMRCTLFSMAAGLVISVAQLAGNQPRSPSLILSP